MKALLFAFSLVVAGGIQGQGQGQAPASKAPPTFEHEEECGSPIVESMVWRIVEGTAVEIVDGDSFLLRTPQGRKIEVDLVAIDAGPAGERAKETLAELILNRRVKVLVGTVRDRDRRITGVAHEGNQDINREMLRRGMARFKTPKASSVSSYVECGYKIAERETRQAQLGLWQGWRD